MIIEKPPTEPSMDEILASIRKIISTDSHEESHSFLPPNETEDILDLTDILPEELEKKQVHPMPSDFHLNDLGEWSPLTENAIFPEEKEKKPPYEGAKTSPYESSTPAFEDSLLSQKTMSEATQAFHSLHKLAKDKPQSSKPRADGTGGQTLDTLVRDMLRPLLKEWLDTHLPSLVRSVVTQQVEKIVNQADMSFPESSQEKPPSSATSHTDYFAA